MTAKKIQLSAKEVANEYATTARKVRKFFRSEVGGVDRGNRYAFTPAQVKAMKKKFDAWAVEEAARIAAEKANK